MMKKSQPDTQTESSESDAVWGYSNIGKVIDRTPSQTRYLVVHTDVLNHAVRKLGHRTIVGSRRLLRDVAVPPA
jgi:hypothetical protein